jgi:uncharacterized repeat protein (TIGR02543 family)
MKKLLLILSLICISFTAFAADLNPFAYNLNSEYNEHAQTLTINFTLNAPASYVKLAISNGTSDVWTKEYLASSYQANKVPKATYTETIDALTLPQGEELTWRVDVKGAAVASPTFVKNDVRLYAPTSVDIDNNPENANFGTVFCVEGRNGAWHNANYTSYISHEDGAGLYVLNADGTARQMPYQTEKVRYGYNGGVVNKDINGNDDRDTPYFGNDGVYDLNGYHAYRVRVSDDGRIFVTSFSVNGHVLWEAKKECFSATTQEEWSANTGWYKIMTTADSNTKMATIKRNCSHDYCGVYSLFEGNASTGTFIAGPNLGFDVRGAGDQLKLLMLAGCKQAVVYSTPAHFYCDEYDLGTATLWNTAPSRRIFAGHSNDPKGIDIVNAQGVQVQYDKSGNVWMCQYRGGTSNTTLARVNRASAATQTDKDNNVTGGHLDYSESNHTYRRCGAIRFNEDFTQVAIASKEHIAAENSGGGFTVYPVDPSTGKPIWEQGTKVKTYDHTGRSLMDFAWDYAGNLYIAADHATNGERIAVYAMPHAADRVVSTPAASKYAFTVSCQAGATYTVTTICDPEEGGTITCQLGGNTRAVGVLTDIPSCTQLTVTATPEPGYQFLGWEDDEHNIVATNPEYTFFVTRDITLTAKFKYATYSGIVWKNLFMNGEDIAKESTAYPGTNERLWRLYQVEYEKYNTSKSGYTVRWHYDTHQPTGVSKLQFNVGTFLYYETRADYNRDFITATTTNTTTPFAWLGDYIEHVSGTTSSSSGHWQYITYLFFNRTNKAYNASGAECTNLVSWTDNTKSFATDYGMPEYWRPWWVEATCGLKKVMSYDDAMPVTWTQESCASGDVSKLGRFNGTAPTSNKETQPSLWYKWNTAPDGKAYDQSQYLLAWRDGASGPIAHYVSRSNMELHASYVDKRLQERDPEPDLSIDPYDATNNDVLSLLNNKNYGATAHNVTMDRKFAGGMYNTICLPFDLPISHLPDELKNADIRVFDGVTETYTESGDPVAVLNFITLDKYWDNWNTAHPDDQVADKNRYMEAGRAYLIKPAADVNDPYLTYSGLPYWRFFDGTRMPYGTDADYVSFQGVLNPTTLPENAYILVADNRLAKVTNTSDKILGYRGYFVIDDAFLRSMADQGNLYFSFQKPVTTSIPVAPEAEQQTKPEVRKIMYDGKIYILRGDEVYTITGHRVK